MALHDLLDRLSDLARGADGLTVSGGEPFDQPIALAAILRHWRSRSSSSILVFTGYEVQAVSPWLAENDGLIDGVISGPFRSELGQTLALRGSDNQQLHVLTDLGSEFAAFDRLSNSSDHRLDVMFDDQGDAWLAGIPRRGDLGRLRRALAEAGHKAVTSDSVRVRQ